MSGSLRPAPDPVDREAEPFRLVLLTGRGIEHRYLAGALARRFPGSLAAIVVESGPGPGVVERLRSLRRRYTASQLLSRALARGYRWLRGRERRRAEALRDVLFPDGDPGGFLHPELVRAVPDHNGEACLALLDRLEPDVIAVYGTRIIRSPVIRRAGRGILNLHTGISPRYRGADTVFWALHNREPEWVGVTVHHLDEDIDSGPILGVGRPEIEPDDDEDTLFAKCVRVGARLYGDAVVEVARGSDRPRSQPDGEGRMYRFVDRTLRAERRVERLLDEGLLERYAGSPT